MYDALVGVQARGEHALDTGSLLTGNQQDSGKLFTAIISFNKILKYLSQHCLSQLAYTAYSS